MEDYDTETPEEQEETLVTEDGEVSSEEEAFMQGYNDEEDAPVCEECGSAIREGKQVVREINGEEHTFCSGTCADEFEESITE